MAENIKGTNVNDATLQRCLQADAEPAAPESCSTRPATRRRGLRLTHLETDWQ